MLVALGFLAASLLGLLLASAFWSRAVRLTTMRIKQSMPVSEPEIKADRDRLRAEYAIKVHKLETQLDQAKLERARQLIEINRRDASISALETDVVAVRADLEENQNARRVLEQTVADRLPKVEARLAEAKRLLFNRDREIAELTQGAKRHKEALEEAGSDQRPAARADRAAHHALLTHGRTGRPRSDDQPEGEGGAARRGRGAAHQDPRAGHPDRPAAAPARPRLPAARRRQHAAAPKQSMAGSSRTARGRHGSPAPGPVGGRGGAQRCALGRRQRGRGASGPAWSARSAA